MKKNGHTATETLALDQILAGLPTHEAWARAVFSRLQRVVSIPAGAAVLDIGAAAGAFVVACSRLGYRCEGVEPWHEARRNAGRLALHLGIPVPVKEGAAERIPFEANTFDVVHASNVIEHVLDVETAFAEAHRVLRPGGVFWFNAASALSPMQDEIQGFPLFGWYPDPLKQRIMRWAKDAKPQLVGYTSAPAINWFTPRKARRMLARHGFRDIYDRWDLRGLEEGGPVYAAALRTIRSSGFTKTLADLAVRGCAFAAVK